MKSIHKPLLPFLRRCALFGAALLLCLAPPAGAARRASEPSRLAGMMGPGMGMGSGMGRGGPAAANDSAAAASSETPGRALVRYIRDQGLSCLRCHAVDAPRFGPSFRAIARAAAGQSDPQDRLRQAIVNGVGRMPPGLANGEQAKQLAHDILELAAHTDAAGAR